MIKKSQLQSAGRCFARSITVSRFAALLLLCAATVTARAGDDNHPPALPPGAEKLAPPADAKVISHVFAVGVQIYRWDGTNWVFVAPEATLYADAGHHTVVGSHFGTPAGPAWESMRGSRVVAQRVDGFTVDPKAIPWLLLRSLSNKDDGIFRNVSHVQRVNTTAGLAPTSPGGLVGEQARIPYTAEYFFYRSTTTSKSGTQKPK